MYLSTLIFITLALCICGFKPKPKHVQRLLSHKLLVFASSLPMVLMLNHPVALAADKTDPDALDVRRVMQEPVNLAPAAPRKQVVKLPSGVNYFDAVEGSGKTAEEGKTVQFQWVLRRSNGYFVDSSDNYGTTAAGGGEAFIYKVGNTKKVIPGLDEAIRGMKVGGVRKINTPAALSFLYGGVGDGKPGPMPAGYGPRRQILTRIDSETWYWEVKLTKVK
jgi:hypothetical protein